MDTIQGAPAPQSTDCFWDMEIYCYSDGRSTSGFYTRPGLQYEATYAGKVIGKFRLKWKAQEAIEIAHAEAVRNA